MNSLSRFHGQQGRRVLLLGKRIDDEMGGVYVSSILVENVMNKVEISRELSGRIKY